MLTSMSVQSLTKLSEAIEEVLSVYGEEVGNLENEMSDLVKQKYHDEESDHGNADRILCNILTELGLTEIVTNYNKLDK